MSSASWIAALWFAASTAAMGLVIRCAAGLRTSDPLAAPHVAWPLALRLLAGPSRLVGGLIGHRFPSTYNVRTRRRLEKADLYPGVGPAQWGSLCVTAAMAGGVAATLLAYLAGAGIFLPAVLSALFAWFCCERWLQSLVAECERRIVRDLPPCLDLFTVCVEAGATLTAAARFVVEQAPPGPLRSYFDRVLREVRSGRARAQAFVGVADTYGVECLSTLASALAHAEAAGMSIGQVLRTQAEQRNAERFVRAEKQAMQAPVKMLGPLIFCIFPCTFIVLAVPIAHRLMEAFRS